MSPAHHILAAATVTVAVVAATAATASGATRIGETFDPQGGAFCGADNTTLQSVSPGARYSAPFAGVITSWSFRAGALPPKVKLKVGRFAGGSDFSIVGESSLKLPTPNRLNTFPVRLRVQEADVIGTYTGTSGFCGRVASGFTDHFHEGDVRPGPPSTFTDESGFQFDVSAALERDRDGDGFGDDTQDACPTDGSTQVECVPPATALTDGPKAKVKTKKKKAKVKFEFSAGEPGASFECSLDGAAFAACTSPLTEKVTKGTHKFAVRAKDEAGNVDQSPAEQSFKVKNKRKRK